MKVLFETDDMDVLLQDSFVLPEKETLLESSTALKSDMYHTLLHIIYYNLIKLQ